MHYTVYKRKCTFLDCDGELIYDGQEQCILAMNQHLFAYEVLRRFMFQFLLGRLVPLYDNYHDLKLIIQLLGQQSLQSILFSQ